MNPRPRKSHVRRGWDASKWPLVIGAFLTAATQIVSMRGQLLDQQEKAATTAESMIAMQSDISKLSAVVFGKQLEPRVARLERPVGRHPSAQPVRGTARADSLTRSPGILWKVARMPWGIIKRMFQGGNNGKDSTPRSP